MQIINSHEKNIDKSHMACEKKFMRIFSHELHVLLDLLLTRAKHFPRNSSQFHVNKNAMRDTFC